MLVGAPLFGWIGDRFGRRVTLISGVFIYGIVSLLTAAAQTGAELLVLRFITGVGLSGVVANGVALIAEFAPKRVRATLVVIAQIGLTFGFMLPAAASGTVEVIYGWRSLFVIGGIAPLAIGIILLFALPESLKFMVVARRPMSQLLRVAKALDPTLQVARDATFVVPDTDIVDARRSHVARLFGDGLVWITLIIWILYNTFLAANYFMHGWMPILFRDQGLTINETAVVAAMFDVGGVIGALVISRLVDKYGVAAIVALYLLACPAVAVIGFVGDAVYLLGAVIFLAGFCLIGITLGMNAITSAIYPTEIRAKGIGWAYGVGRFGSMIGPLVGGWLVGMKLPISQLFLAPVVPLSVGTVLSFMLMRLSVNRDKGSRFRLNSSTAGSIST
jgi:MFS transporter, AAHS family, 4-hydroxybenzoate transporter